MNTANTSASLSVSSAWPLPSKPAPAQPQAPAPVAKPAPLPLPDPAHYQSLPVDCPHCGGRIPARIVCEAMPGPGWLFNAIKYLWRFQFKGDPLKDLAKARDCLDHEIAIRTKH